MPSINLSNIQEKNYWECLESNPGLLGEKPRCCAAMTIKSNNRSDKSGRSSLSKEFAWIVFLRFNASRWSKHKMIDLVFIWDFSEASSVSVRRRGWRKKNSVSSSKSANVPIPCHGKENVNLISPREKKFDVSTRGILARPHLAPTSPTKQCLMKKMPWLRLHYMGHLD